MWFFKKKSKDKAISKSDIKDIKSRVTTFEIGKESQPKFEFIYKQFYRMEKYTTKPKWTLYFDMMFMGDTDVIKVSKGEVIVGKLITLEEITETPFKIVSVYGLIKYLEYIVHNLVRMYIEDENEGFKFSEDIKELKKLGLVSKDIYVKLKFLSKIKAKVANADRIKDIKYTDDRGVTYRLIDLEANFKTIYYEVLKDVSATYIEVQEPFIDKFYNIWEHKALNKENGRTFYRLR